jgi:hypothetical protein
MTAGISSVQMLKRFKQVLNRRILVHFERRKRMPVAPEIP